MSTAAVTIVFFYACGCVCVRERVKENRSKTKITRKVNRRDVTKISVKLLTKKKKMVLMFVVCLISLVAEQCTKCQL